MRERRASCLRAPSDLAYLDLSLNGEREICLCRDLMIWISARCLHFFFAPSDRGRQLENAVALHSGPTVATQGGQLRFESNSVSSAQRDDAASPRHLPTTLYYSPRPALLARCFKRHQLLLVSTCDDVYNSIFDVLASRKTERAYIKMRLRGKEGPLNDRTSQFDSRERPDRPPTRFSAMLAIGHLPSSRINTCDDTFPPEIPIEV